VQAAFAGNDVFRGGQCVLQLNLGFLRLSFARICGEIWRFWLEICGAREVRNRSQVEAGEDRIRQHAGDENDGERRDENGQRQPDTTNAPPTTAVGVMENGSHNARKTQVRWLDLSIFCGKLKAVHDETPWTAGELLGLA
jgi:hypothetical protein